MPTQDTSTNPLIKPSIKVMATDSTAADYTFTFPGVFNTSYTSANLGSVVVANAQNAVITFVGTGADNATFTCTIWAKVPIAGATALLDSSYFLQSVGVATCILSTMTIATGTTAFPTTYRVVDTIVWVPSTNATTPVGNYTDLCAAFGVGTGTVNNGGNTPATLILPVAGECESFVFDFKLGTATAMNAFAQPNVC